MITLLDAGGAFLVVIPVFLFVFMTIIIFLEGWILKRLQYNTFKKSVIASLVANFASLVAGWGILGLVGMKISVINVLILFVISLIVEGGVFHFMNRDFSLKKIIYATAMVNAASYLILLIFIILIGGF